MYTDNLANPAGGILHLNPPYLPRYLEPGSHFLAHFVAEVLLDWNQLAE